MLKHKIKDINKVGRIISEYYRNSELVMQVVKKGTSPDKIFKKK